MDIVMPFGMHVGVPLDQVPLDYCVWAYSNLKQLDPLLRDSLWKQMQARQVDVMYYSVDPFRPVVLPVGIERPSSAWCQFIEANGSVGKEPVPVFLLTAQVYGLLFWRTRKTEDLCLRGKESKTRLLAMRRILDQVTAYVNIWWPNTEVVEAIQEIGNKLEDGGETLPPKPNSLPPEAGSPYTAKRCVEYGYLSTTNERGEPRRKARKKQA